MVQKKTHPKKLPKIAKNRQKQGKNILLRTHQTIFLVHHMLNPVPNPMVLLPGLKIGVIKKYAQKTKFKMAQDGLKPGK